MRRAWRRRALALTVATLGAGAAACPDVPEAGVLALEGELDREGVGQTNLATVDVDFRSEGARGEWWTCELRVTAESCVGQHHVNAWVAMPGTQAFDDLGQAGCVEEGTAFGAFEQLTAELSNGDAVIVPDDAEVLVLVASDLDGDGSPDLDDDAEVTAASRLAAGQIELFSLGSFDDPVSLRITGTTVGGVDLTLDVQGPTNPVTTPAGLDVARTCVAPD